MLPNTLPTLLKTQDDYIRYLENIAYSMNDIQHSEDVRRFFTRLEDVAGTGLVYPLMVAIPDTVFFTGPRDAMFEMFPFRIWILKSLGPGNDKEMRKLIDECKIIADEIMGKLDYDSDPIYGTACPFRKIVLPETTGEALDDPMLGDKVVGWELSVAMGNQRRFIYDATKWR